VNRQFAFIDGGAAPIESAMVLRGVLLVAVVATIGLAGAYR